MGSEGAMPQVELPFKQIALSPPVPDRILLPEIALREGNKSSVKWVGCSICACTRG